MGVLDRASHSDLKKMLVSSQRHRRLEGPLHLALVLHGSDSMGYFACYFGVTDSTNTGIWERESRALWM